jgi:hypothetical protein
MLTLPPEPQPGQPVQASWGVAIVRYLRALTPSGGPGIAVDVGPGGTKIRALAKPTSSRPGAADLHPFKLLDVSTEETLKVRVVIGTLGGLIPDGFVIGDTPTYEITITDDCVVYGAVGVNASGGVTDAWVDTAASLPADTTAAIHIAIGYVAVVEGELQITQSLHNNVHPFLYYSFSSEGYLLGNWSVV